MSAEDYDITCSIDDLCYPDFYQGHGDVHEPDNLAACFPFAIYVTQDFTNQQVEDHIVHDINQQDWPLEIASLDPKYCFIREAIREEIDQAPEEQPFKDMDLGEDVYLYGYIHFYRKET